MTPGIGQILDEKYRILRLVGEGGMGAVYEAEHSFLGRRVAIKVLAPEYARHADAVTRFYREAQAAARIGHENICEVTDVGRTPDGSPYIVMELLQGMSLGRAVAESAPFAIGRTVAIATQVLEALEAAHAAGIVHRDMKPDNIFLTRVAGREDFVKLLDFGISKMRSGGIGVADLTQTGVVLGTPQYMSPEQARGLTDVDGRVDVWAVGVIVFEMLSGRVPFEGDNYNKVMFSVATDPIPSLRAFREAVTPELEAVVMRAMERDLDRRFATALEFRDALLGAWMGVAESGFAVRASDPLLVPTPFPGGLPGENAAAVQASSGPTIGGTVTIGPSVARRSRTRLIAAVAVGSVLVAAAAVLALRGGAGSDRSARAADAPPARSAAAPSASTAVPSGFPDAVADAGAIREPRPLAVATGPDGGTGAASNSAPPPGPVEVSPTPAPIAPAEAAGTLAVETDPRTRVLIDGVPFARAPFAGRELPAGRYRIRYENPERGVSFEEWLVIVAGQETVVARSAEQLGAVRPPVTAGRRDAGGASSAGAADAGRVPDGIRILTTYGRDGR